MSKIRINELARELEVKPSVIIDLLPDLGVPDKKTHSSSLDDDVVVELKRRVASGIGGGGKRIDRSAPDSDGDSSEHQESPQASAPDAAPNVSAPSVAARPVASEPTAAAPSSGSGDAAPKVSEGPVTPPLRAALPLRPPLSSGQRLVPPIATAPATPVVPRGIPIPGKSAPPPPRPGQLVSGPRQPLPSNLGAAPPVQAPPASPAAPAAPVSATPAVPATPAQPTPAAPPATPVLGTPALGTPRPPAAPVAAAPGAPRPAPSAPPSMPLPQRPATRPPGLPIAHGLGPNPGGVHGGGAPGAPRQMPTRQFAPGPNPAGPGQAAHGPSAHQGPGQSGPGPGSPLRPPSRPTLAGQPAARPVVPPRPDLVARLTRPPGVPMPGGPAPGQPRPGAPARPASPIPGQPIYRGTVRPGQPLMRGPGGPGGPSGYQGQRPAGPGGPMRGRPMHPTSPLRAEPQPLPADPGRRHATKPGTGGRGGGGRRRDADPEEGRIRPQSRRQQEFVPPEVDREITIAEGITVKELSEKLGIKANLLIKRLVERKIFATINQTMDVKLAEDLARDFGASTNKLTYEEESTHEIQQTEVDVDRERRPPVVTIMGHVDHGKTSLLDSIRSANVAGREAGGITQHIGAYHVEKNGRKIVFIDTPGHEAFTRMRARGAKVTDIVILVVAADDGVMPQTLEAIDHAKAAGVPIIVAINKIDKPDAQPDRIKQQLSDRGLLAEDWGGDTVMVPVSAKAKTNLELLLEMILLVADLQDLKANPARPAMGTVLEAKLDRGRGPVATVLVRNGTLHVGDYFICGSVFGRVRAMFDDQGAPTREVLPSMPAEVLGLESLPEVGDTLQAVTDTAKAKQIVIYRESKAREVAMSKNKRVTLEQLHDQLKEGETKELNIILKTDVGGTAEVLSDTLQKLSNDKVKIRVLHSGVGAITESDVLLASASNAIIVGFNVRPDRTAQSVADQEKVDIRLHTIIYELSDQIKKAMSGMLDPVFKETYKGRAEIRDVFRISKVGAVAGCAVVDGVITRSSQVRLIRDNVVVHTGKVEGLKRFKNDASEVKAGFECGISLANYNDMKPGDVIEAFAMEKVAQEAIA